MDVQTIINKLAGFNQAASCAALWDSDPAFRDVLVAADDHIDVGAYQSLPLGRLVDDMRDAVKAGGAA